MSALEKKSWGQLTKVLCLAQQVAVHRTLICSLPTSQWDGGENWKKKVEPMDWDKTIY